jgi:adenine-specific DNA-methyltransferase
MKSEQVHSLTNNFEAHSHQTGGGVAFWLARDIQHLLGDGKWENLLHVVNNAKTACEVSGHAVPDHFPDVRKMVDLGSGSQPDVDVFDPGTSEVRSDGADGIACWFIDTDYNEESFFVRHAYFLGANDPYKALKTTLRAEIDVDAWATLNSDTSRPFPKPSTGHFAVKVINHLGDEVMKVFII